MEDPGAAVASNLDAPTKPLDNSNQGQIVVFWSAQVALGPENFRYGGLVARGWFPHG